MRKPIITRMKKDNTTAIIIICGGQSKRLWPLSKYQSKNFLNLWGKPPLEETLLRFLDIVPRENIFFVGAKKEKNSFYSLAKKYKLKRNNFILEPQAKNTAAAVLLGLLAVESKLGDKKVVIAPIDHLIKPQKKFLADLKCALSAAQEGKIVTFAIMPRFPSVNFGYIELDKKKKLAGCAYKVKRFIEKPSLKKAKILLKKGNYFFNSGIFVSTLNVLLSQYRSYYKEFSLFSKYYSHKSLDKIYSQLEDIPFDKAIMEKTKDAASVIANFSWYDFGTWNAVYELLPKDSSKNAVAKKVFVSGGKENLVYKDKASLGKKKILVLGLDRIRVVDTPEFLLISSEEGLDLLKSSLKEIDES